VAVTLFDPAGRAVVVNVAVPEARVAVPKTVVDPLFEVEKLNVPTLLAGVTAAVKVTGAPAKTFVAAVDIVMDVAVREAAHASANTLVSTEPRPVTRS